MKIAGSESGSISQRHGFADLDPDPYRVPKCQGSATLLYTEHQVSTGFMDDIDFSRLEGKEAASPAIKGPAVEIFVCCSTMS